VARIYKSGAFVRQCFASHPLCLNPKKLPAADLIVLACSSCHLLHHLRVRHMTSQLPMTVSDPTEQQRPQDPAEQHLARCISAHASALRVGAMDVVQDQVTLRCVECRRTYAVEVSDIETHVP
jgi:hypothetical protein